LSKIYKPFVPSTGLAGETHLYYIKQADTYT